MSKSRDASAYAAEAADTFLFSGLTEAETAALLSVPGTFVRHYGKGEDIESRTVFSRMLALILSGSAAVTKENGGVSMRMSTLSRGDLFGAASVFCEAEEYVGQITAETSTWTLEISESALRTMLCSDARVMENYIRYLTARIRFLSGRLDGFVQPSVEDRVLAFLTANAADGVCTLPYGMSALADALCISRATLYRALDVLTARGAIERAGKTFTIRL